MTVKFNSINETNKLALDDYTDRRHGYDAGNDKATRYPHCLVDNGNGTLHRDSAPFNGNDHVHTSRFAPDGPVDRDVQGSQLHPGQVRPQLHPPRLHLALGQHHRRIAHSLGSGSRVHRCSRRGTLDPCLIPLRSRRHLSPAPPIPQPGPAPYPQPAPPIPDPATRSPDRPSRHRRSPIRRRHRSHRSPSPSHRSRRCEADTADPISTLCSRSVDQPASTIVQ